MHHQSPSSQNDDTAPHLPTYGADEHHSTPHMEATAITSQVSENNAPQTASNPSEGIFTSGNYLISAPQDRVDVTTNPHIRAGSALNGSTPAFPTNLQATPLPLVPAKGLSGWYRNQEPGTQLWLGSGIISLVLAICACIFSVMMLSQPAGTAIIPPHPTATSMPQNTSATTGPAPTTPTQNIISTSTSIQPITQPGQSNLPTYPPAQPTQPGQSNPPTYPPAQPTQPGQSNPPTQTTLPSQPTQPPAQPIQPAPPPDKPIHSQPTPTPFPTPVPTPIPTPVPTPIPTPTPPTGINGNPWGYDFFPGNYITRPPAAFCSYFACVQNFFRGRGYIVECTDGTYSLWGGTWVACTWHGNVVTPLYSH